MAWTDDELRAATYEAGLATIISPYYLRHLLTALGIDHQPKPELPTEVGAHIRDVTGRAGLTCEVMTLDKYGAWNGVDEDGDLQDWEFADITSWRPLNLEALEEGEQGE